MQTLGAMGAGWFLGAIGLLAVYALDVPFAIKVTVPFMIGFGATLWFLNRDHPDR